MHLTDKERAAVVRVFGLEVARLVESEHLDVRADVERVDQLPDEHLANVLRATGAAIGLCIADLQMLSQRAAGIAAELANRRARKGGGDWAVRYEETKASFELLRQEVVSLRQERDALRAKLAETALERTQGLGRARDVADRLPPPAEYHQHQEPPAAPDAEAACVGSTREEIDAAMRELKRPGVGGEPIAAELRRRGLRTPSGLEWTAAAVNPWLQTMKRDGRIDPAVFAAPAVGRSAV